MKKLLALALVAAGLLLGPNVARADILIDNFDDGLGGNPGPFPAATRFGDGTTAGNFNPAPGAGVVLGGNRNYTNVISNLNPADPILGSRIVAVAGKGNYGADPPYKAVYSITYDAAGGALGLNADFTGNTKFLLEARGDANDPHELTLEVEDQLGGVDSASRVVPKGAVFQTLTIPFAEFIGVDFSKIRRLTLTLNSTDTAEIDAQLDDFRVNGIIPEPATAVLLIGGLAGLGCARAVRRKFARK